MNSGPWDKKEKVGITPSADRIKGGKYESKSQQEELSEGGSGFWWRKAGRPGRR